MNHKTYKKSAAKISIVDYGVGNLHSLIKAVELFTKNVTITDDEKMVESSDAIILPGVGAFGAGMQGLRIRNLVPVIKKFSSKNKPMLGICLGAQLLFSEGHEFDIFNGLDIIFGKVVAFPKLKNNEKLPNVGWNKLIVPKNKSWKRTILDSVSENSYVYFVHSYLMEPKSKDWSLAFTSYGGIKYTAVVKKGNIYGCQFHPEKSGDVGLKMIHNFVDLI